ncbi:MAG: hypothetical protein EBE86_027070 [Hormoscilla sp. GUM202]|nr:hypothetical protein [Hormoscilla sp. GUM202]
MLLNFKFSQLAFKYGVSRKDNLKSYVVFLGVTNYGETTTLAILCEADYPGRTKPATPTYRNGRLACGEGTTEL